jgi:uncharacterized damage-inducible protein DinB
MNETYEIGNAFVRQARSHLRDDFMPKIRRCLEVMEEGDLWWRAHETDNSVGNLVLHLCGNVRQWIISGIGGAPDSRERSKEFSERNPVPGKELLTKLGDTLTEADQVLAAFPVDQIMKPCTIQGYRQTALQAIFHVVEHFSYHTGQIIYITKMRRGIDLKFYNL